MTREEFSARLAADPAADDVLAEVNRLYNFEADINERLPAIESERDEFRKKYTEANERYIKRFLSGEPDVNQPEVKKEKVTIDSLFKEAK